MIHAKPNPNGNTPEHFREAYTDVQAAEKALRAALTTVRMNVMHGRNYLGDNDTRERRRVEDEERLNPLIDAVRALQRLEAEIAEATGW